MENLSVETHTGMLQIFKTALESGKGWVCLYAIHNRKNNKQAEFTRISQYMNAYDVWLTPSLSVRTLSTVEHITVGVVSSTHYSACIQKRMEEEASWWYGYTTTSYTQIYPFVAFPQISKRKGLGGVSIYQLNFLSETIVSQQCLRKLSNNRYVNSIQVRHSLLLHCVHTIINLTWSFSLEK
jgi:hypothetical protein